MEASEAIDTQADGDAAAPAFASGGGNGIFASPTDIAAASSGKTKVAFSVHDGDTASNSFHGAAASSIVEAACGDAGDIDVVAAADSSRPLTATASTDDGDGSASAGVGAIHAEGGSGLLASEQAEMATIDDDATETTSCDLALVADGAAAVEEDTASSAAATGPVLMLLMQIVQVVLLWMLFSLLLLLLRCQTQTSRSALAGAASDSAVADALADSAATVESQGTKNVAVRCNVDEDDASAAVLNVDAADGSAAESRHVSEINQPK